MFVMGGLGSTQHARSGNSFMGQPLSKRVAKYNVLTPIELEECQKDDGVQRVTAVKAALQFYVGFLLIFFFPQ